MYRRFSLFFCFFSFLFSLFLKWWNPQPQPVWGTQRLDLYLLHIKSPSLWESHCFLWDSILIFIFKLNSCDQLRDFCLFSFNLFDCFLRQQLILSVFLWTASSFISPSSCTARYDYVQLRLYGVLIDDYRWQWEREKGTERVRELTLFFSKAVILIWLAATFLSLLLSLYLIFMSVWWSFTATAFTTSLHTNPDGVFFLSGYICVCSKGAFVVCWSWGGPVIHLGCKGGIFMGVMIVGLFSFFLFIC